MSKNKEMEFRSLNEKGIQLCDEGHFRRALKKFNEALKLKPNDFNTLRRKGTLLLTLNECEKAIHVFSKGIEVSKTLTQVSKILVSCLYGGRGLAYTQLFKFEKGIIDLKKAISLHPEDTTWHNNLSISYIGLYRQGKRENPSFADEALKHSNKSIQLDPKNVSAYGNRGGIYSEMADTEKGFNRKFLAQAIENYDKALELDPQNFDALVNRAKLNKILLHGNTGFGSGGITAGDLMNITRNNPALGKMMQHNNMKGVGEAIQRVHNSIPKYPFDQIHREKKRNKYCHHCGKVEGKLYKCARCTQVFYCSRDCQVKEWKEHKKICKKKE